MESPATEAGSRGPGSEMPELVKVDGTWVGYTRFTTSEGLQRSPLIAT